MVRFFKKFGWLFETTSFWLPLFVKCLKWYKGCPCYHASTLLQKTCTPRYSSNVAWCWTLLLPNTQFLFSHKHFQWSKPPKCPNPNVPTQQAFRTKPASHRGGQESKHRKWNGSCKRRRWREEIRVWDGWGRSSGSSAWEECDIFVQYGSVLAGYRGSSRSATRVDGQVGRKTEGKGATRMAWLENENHTFGRSSMLGAERVPVGGVGDTPGWPPTS